MRLTALFATLGALFVSVIAGCGGNVKVDPSGTGGDGGGGTGGGTSSSTSITTSPTTTVTDPKSYCEELCTTFQQSGCLDGDVTGCVQGCSQLFSEYPECNAEIKDLYDCFGAALASQGCNLDPDTCKSQNDIAGVCINGGMATCGTNGCSASGNNDCSCTGDCNGYALQADCKGTPGAVECSCLVDGQYAGSCKDSDLTCDLFVGCCAQYFPL